MYIQNSFGNINFEVIYMKKFTILFLVFFLIGSVSIGVNAETLKPAKKTKINVTTENIFVDLVTPYVTEAVKKEHGNKATWKSEGVKHLSINNDHTVDPPKSWYEVRLNILVHDNEKNENHSDTVIVKIDTNTYLGSSLQKDINLENVSIEVKQYIHGEQSEKQMN